MIRLQRPPRNDDELHAVVKAMFGVDIPRKQVCPDHVAPFTAFSHAFFAKDPNTAAWYGSRGTGKSYLLALLGIAKTTIHMCSSTILGGSIHQSNNVYNHMETMMRFPNAPSDLVTSFTRTSLTFANHTTVVPLSASPTSVRGPHPTLHLLDEVDEMDYDVYVASLAQAMRQPNALGVEMDEYVVKSSTWQHEDGSFSKVLEEHRDKNIPIFAWCTARDTNITMGDGSTKYIQDVVPGDRVLTRSGPAVVQHATRMGVKPTVIVTTEDGRSVTCTADHKIAIPGGWCEAGLLSPGSDVLAIARPAVTSSIGRHVEVGTGIGVSLGTLSPGQLGLDMRHAPAVFCESDRLQVVGVDTRRVTADHVVETFTRVGSSDQSPYGAVGLGLAESSVPVEHPMAAFTTCSLPLPASIVGDDRLAADVLHVEDHLGREFRSGDGLLDALPAVAGGAVLDRYPTLETVHVVSITPGADVETWDIGVEGDDHEFVANGILVHNCYREMLKPHGWMDPGFIERKRLTVPAELWRVEYDLGEPSGATSVFDMGRLKEVFVETPEIALPSRHSQNNDLWIYEERNPRGVYAMGVDLAKTKDWTVAIVARTDIEPIRIVAVKKVGRIPWDNIVNELKELKDLYQAEMGHDGTGLGSVVTDLLEGYSRQYLFVGDKRKKLLNEMIANVESRYYQFPTGNPLYSKFKSTKAEDVWSTTLVNSHLPDETAAMAVLNAVCDLTTGGVRGRTVDKPRDQRSQTVKEMHEGVNIEPVETVEYEEFADSDQGRSVFVATL